MIKDSEEALLITKEHKFLHDCAVLAHAIAFDKDYITAKNEILGLGLNNYWREYAKVFPVKEVVVFSKGYHPEEGITFTEHPPLGKKITTVKQFFKTVKLDEVWIVGVWCHVFAIKDGIIYDRKRYQDDNSGWRRKVNVAYKIK